MPNLSSDKLPGCAEFVRKVNGDSAGKASFMPSWLLVEQPGAWRVDILRHTIESVMPKDRMAELERAGMRFLLIRKPGRGERSSERRMVYWGNSTPGNRWLEKQEITDLSEIASIDLEAVTRGESGQGEPVAHPLLLVCTHGAKDMCCALFGRPVVNALLDRYPKQTWEVSHVGGDRWAANVLSVPDGFMYGKLDPKSAITIADATCNGRVDPRWLRGRTTTESPWQQYAEIAIRHYTGLTGLDEVLAVDEFDQDQPERTRVVIVDSAVGGFAVTIRGDAQHHHGDISRCSTKIDFITYVTEDIRELSRV